MLPRFHPRRTRWQLLFVEGTKEYVRVPGKEGRRIQTISGDFLRELEANHKRRIANAVEYGGVFSPLPVSYDHAIFRAVYAGEKLDEHATRRAGGLWDLCYYDGEDHPIGLYGLHEWTSEALYRITSGDKDTLSPTTGYDEKLTDQTILRGQSIIEVGLVHLPALDTIGRATDWLPFDTLPTDFEPSEGGRASGLTPRKLQTKQPLDAVCRMAYVLPKQSQDESMENDNTQEPRMDGEGDEPRAYSEPRMDLEMIAQLGEMAEGLMAFVTDLRAEYEREGEEGDEPDDDAPAEPENRGENMEPRAADPTPEPAPEPEPRSLAQRAQEAETARLEKEVLGYVQRGRLLAKDADTAIARMRTGESVDDLLGEYSLGELTGRNADDTETEPRSKRTSTVTENDLLREARSAHPNNPAKALEAFRTMRSEAKANNTLASE